MIKHLRYAAIAITAVSTVGMASAATGVASIDTTGAGSVNDIRVNSGMQHETRNTNAVNVTNSNQQTAQSGNVSASGGSAQGGWHDEHGTWESDDPAAWQAAGRGFGDWWSHMMMSMGQHMMGGWGTSNWSPTDSGWQNSWSNWDPMMWQQHGSSFGNWHNQMLGYMLGGRGAWEQGWNAGGGNTSVGNLMSGEASNVNSTDTAASIDNSSSAAGMMMPAEDPIDVMISQTGADSLNGVTIDHRNHMSVTNTNDVSIANLNNQTARSGNVSANRNTTVGSLMSGDAMNTNSTTTTLSIKN